jgi:thiamine pyrophosphokinase
MQTPSLAEGVFMANGRRAWIFVNGILEDIQGIRSWIKPGDLTIAADGGARYAALLGLTPDLLVGDLDSIAPALRDLYMHQGVRILQHPVEKDESDLELAVQMAIQEGCSVIRILSAMGGRLDHTLGNLAPLMDPHLQGVDIRLADTRQEVLVIWHAAEIQGKAGDLLSLLPVNGDAQGVWTEGLYYPLNHETLYPYKTRGISNVLLGESARIGLSAGQLLCIHIRV